MALFTAASFPGATVDVPQGKSWPTANAADPISLQLSDGSTVQLFDSLTSCLLCANVLRTRNQHSVSLTDDVQMHVIGGCKVLLMEQSLVNQRLQSQYAFVLANNGIRCVHRSMSLVLTLEEALSSVGWLRTTTGSALNTNADLSAGSNPPRIKVVDINWPNSLLTDANPLVLDVVP